LTLTDEVIPLFENNWQISIPTIFFFTLSIPHSPQSSHPSHTNFFPQPFHFPFSDFISFPPTTHHPQKKVLSSLMHDLRDLPPTDENIILLLGHPTISVNPSQRNAIPECTNCGRTSHTCQNCPLPNMEQLLEHFGAECFDSSATAVESKKKIVSDLYAGQ
jgi:hypothetical protein